jgi:hypothetical protein
MSTQSSVRTVTNLISDTVPSTCPKSHGIYRYRNWLPVVHPIHGASRTVAYRSQGLGAALGLHNLWIAFNAVRIVSVEGDHCGAVDLAATVSALPGFQAAGATWNVVRRDGLATVLLSAAESMKSPPDLYFQAAGSGAGVIAAHEAASRLISSGPHTISVQRTPKHYRRRACSAKPVKANGHPATQPEPRSGRTRIAENRRDDS